MLKTGVIISQFTKEKLDHRNQSEILEQGFIPPNGVIILQNIEEAQSSKTNSSVLNFFKTLIVTKNLILL